jgi:pimeloyl-ACP methyl ester carboxylesterase
MRAVPATAKQLRASRLPLALPVIDIVAERTCVNSPEEVSAMGREHAAFVAASPTREAVFVTGSGHYVMSDRPDLVIDVVTRMIDRVRTLHSPPRPSGGTPTTDSKSGFS